ncbi:MAG TPA: YraN family protein [Nocardioides sp.]|jgi:putative endonuclease|uniref:YraN family protein n=1 Tax=Nocardioides sp. TaxID=35761 RepID=UPI002E2F3896|nr:YraN family protein [Nocardioides sp.]HEX3931026.1 YraN family protein [Nocardioides sp.]
MTAEPLPAPPTTRRAALGSYGERVAARHLAGLGMRLLDRNWRCDVGEIDLVLRDGDVLVVCEVKTRASLACGSPHEAITDDKLERLKRLALCWATEHGLRPQEVRIDLVAVYARPRGAAVVEHVPGLV